MKTTEYEQFERLLRGIYTFYRVELTSIHLEIWWRAMQKFDLRALQEAFSLHMLNPDNGQWLPKPADVVRLVAGGTADRALLAWSKFETAVQYVGQWDSVVFDDPIIHQVVDDMGGWRLLCGKPEKEWPFVKNDFVTRYRGYAVRPLVTYPSKLVGQIEAENMQHYPSSVPEPKFVGDEARARMVLANGATGSKSTLIGTLVKQLETRLLPEG